MSKSIIEKIQRLFANKWLIAAVILLGMILVLQWTRKTAKYEGFQQKEPFTVARDANSYDEFYAEIYDRLYKTEKRADSDALKIIESTQPDKKTSVFLDVGCGTGCLVDALKRRGYNAVGVDQSQAMIEVGKERRPKTCNKSAEDGQSAIRSADATDPMLFDRGVFSHILCMDRTIYELQDKVAFFRNCKHWLLPGGYLIVHLVEPDKYNVIVPLGQPSGLGPVQKPDGTRVTDTAIDFVDFKYKSSYDFSGLKDGVVKQIETFTDTASNNVRQNERTMYMTASSPILEDARYCGFLLQGEFASSEDPGQKVVILKAL